MAFPFPGGSAEILGGDGTQPQEPILTSSLANFSAL